MRVLVTGANGYLGRGVVKQLLDDGNEVIATDFSCQGVDQRAKRYEVNLFDVANPYDEFDKPEVVLHMAWRDGFKHYSDNHISDLPKHYQFIDKIVSSPIERIAVMGSMHEIGFYEGSIDEDTPTNPQSLYGISKNALRGCAELLCQNNQKKLQWIRGFYIVGNAQNGSSIFSKIARASETGEKSFPFTMGLNQFDFIDYNDFCVQVATIVEQSEVTGIINACSGRPMKLRERVELYIKENNYNIKLDYGTFPDRPYDSKAIWGNSKKIEEIMAKRNNKCW